MISLLQGDCLDLLPTLAAASVDLILADLPYGTTVCAWDSIIPLDKLWPLYTRVLKPRGAVVLTAGQPFTSALVMSNLKWFKYCWVWEKTRHTNFLNSANRPLSNHEDIVVFSPGTVGNGSSRRMTYNPQIDLTQPGWQKKIGQVPWNNTRSHEDSVYRRGGRKTFPPGYINSGEGRQPKSVLHIANPAYQGANQLHPTQKPVALMEYLINTYSNPGDLVLDNTMGSGTTGVAAVTLGRAFIGMELNLGYYAVARDRIRAVAADQPAAA